MFYLKCKLFRTCDFCDINPLKGFKINSRYVMKEIIIYITDSERATMTP